MGDKLRQDLGALGSAVEKLRKPASDWATPTTGSRIVALSSWG